MKKIKTDVERRALISAVERRAIDKGLSVVKAARALGIHPSSYYGWKKKFSKQSKKPQKIETIIYKPEAKEKPLKNKRGKLVAVIGDARAIADLIMEMGNE